MREWKATLTSEKSFSGWIFNSAQPPKGTLRMSARRICVRAAQRFSTLAPRQISIACGTPSYYPPPRFRALALFSRRPSQRSVDRRHRRPEKLHKAQTQRFRAVSSASALYPEHPSVSRPSRAAPDLRPVIEAAPNSGYSDYLPSCSVGGRRVR